MTLRFEASAPVKIEAEVEANDIVSIKKRNTVRIDLDRRSGRKESCCKLCMDEFGEHFSTSRIDMKSYAYHLYTRHNPFFKKSIKLIGPGFLKCETYNSCGFVDVFVIDIPDDEDHVLTIKYNVEKYKKYGQIVLNADDGFKMVSAMEIYHMSNEKCVEAIHELNKEIQFKEGQLEKQIDEIREMKYNLQKNANIMITEKISKMSRLMSAKIAAKNI